MTRYFHYWLTCPSCFEPHISSNFIKPLKKVSNYIQCRNRNCRANFLERFKITRSLYDKNLPDNEEYIPLCWEINPNPIEKSYLEWIKSDKILGKFYLITWPWNEVKFIPLIIQDFLFMHSPKRPVLIFSKYIREGHPLDGKKSPAHNILFKSLITYYEDEENSKSLTYDKKKEVYDIIDKMHKVRSLHLLEYDLDGQKIKRYTARKIGDKELPKGAEVKFRHQVLFKGKIKYNKDWMTFIISNYDKLYKHNLRNIYEIIDSENKPDEVIKGKSVVFFKSKHENSPKSSLIKDLIEQPSLVIIENLEYFLHQFRKDDFFEFLKSLNNDCIVLLFSTSPGQRYLHMDFINEFNHKLIFHCWDTENRIEWLKEKKDFDVNEYINPGSSKLEEMRISY